MRARIAIASALVLLLAGCGQPQPEVGSPAKVCIVSTDRLMPAAPSCGDAGALALSVPPSPVDVRR